MNSPLITVPTTLPRSSSLASDAAKATRIWPTTERRPDDQRGDIEQAEVRDNGCADQPRAVTSDKTTTSRRRSSRSPSGRRRSKSDRVPDLRTRSR